MSCLFNSLSHFIKDENPFTIRQKICDYLAENKAIIDGLETNEILKFENNNYVSNMRSMNTWGGAIEIQVACNIWKLKINVHNYRDNNKKVIEFIPLNNDFNNVINIYWNGGHYEPITNI